MDKKDLANILSDLLLPLGFKKKGNCWAKNRAEVNTLVNLQKSEFANKFYVNYGYVLNALPLKDTTTHIFKGLGSVDRSEQIRIDELLRLENDIPDDVRKEEFRRVMLHRLIPEIDRVETENDVLQVIKQLPTLNGVPLIVKKHFNLPVD